MGEFGPWHLLIVAFVFVVLFGSKKLPDAARSVGRSLRIFKSEMHGLRQDEPAAPDTTNTALPTVTTAPVSPMTAATPLEAKHL
jgi:sec-independent protein translocase protein TatA